jgi:uncharacterized paraquat-inducible protein A
MLTCPKCNSNLSFRQLLSAKASIIKCEDCKSRLQVSGEWPTLFFMNIAAALFIAIAVAPLYEHIGLLLVATTALWMASWYVAVWIFYSVVPLSD